MPTLHAWPRISDFFMIKLISRFLCLKEIFRTAIFLVDYDESALIKVVHNWIEHSVDHRGSSHMNNSGDLIYVAVRGGICIECYNQQ
jgi:hypothetical protein